MRDFLNGTASSGASPPPADPGRSDGVVSETAPAAVVAERLSAPGPHLSPDGFAPYGRRGRAPSLVGQLVLRETPALQAPPSLLPSWSEFDLELPFSMFQMPALELARPSLLGGEVGIGQVGALQSGDSADGGHNPFNLRRLSGPSVAGTLLAGAAMATGLGINLSQGTLFGPTDRTHPHVSITGSPSLSGGTVTLNGTF